MYTNRRYPALHLMDRQAFGRLEMRVHRSGQPTEAVGLIIEECRWRALTGSYKSQSLLAATLSLALTDSRWESLICVGLVTWWQIGGHNLLCSQLPETDGQWRCVERSNRKQSQSFWMLSRLLLFGLVCSSKVFASSVSLFQDFSPKWRSFDKTFGIPNPL